MSPPHETEIQWMRGYRLYILQYLEIDLLALAVLKENIKYSIHVFWAERHETVQNVCSALAERFCGCFRVEQSETIPG